MVDGGRRMSDDDRTVEVIIPDRVDSPMDGGVTLVRLPDHGTPQFASLCEEVARGYYEAGADSKEQSWESVGEAFRSYLRGEASEWLASLRRAAIRGPHE
jgi:hypothetical protein